MICTLHLLNGDKAAMGLNINGSWVDTKNGTVHFSTANDIDRVYFNNVKVWEKERDQVLNTRTDITYTAPGYTLYGDYFLSNIVIANKNWNEARAMSESITVTKTITTTITYSISGEKTSSSMLTKIATAKILSKAELETLSAGQRKISENGHYWYWTSTPSHDGSAWDVNSYGGRCSVNRWYCKTSGH